MALAAAGIIGGATLASGISSGIGNYFAGKKTAEAGEYSADQSLEAAKYTADMQEKINQANIEFQQRENEITRGREDTAHQREVADLMNAGLSPLASTSGAQTAALTAPSMDSSGYSTAGDIMARGAQTEAEYVSKGAQLRSQTASQFAGSVASAVNQMAQLRSQFINDSATSAQTAYTNALAEEKSLSNSFLVSKYTLELQNLAEALKFSKAHQALLKQQKDESKSHQKWYDTDTEKQAIWNSKLGDFIQSEIDRNFSSSNVNNATSFKIYGEEDRKKQEFEQLKNLNLPLGTALSLNLGGPFNIYGATKQFTNDALTGLGNLGTAIQKKVLEYVEAINSKIEADKAFEREAMDYYLKHKDSFKDSKEAGDYLKLMRSIPHDRD